LVRPFQTAFKVTLAPAWTDCEALALGPIRLELQTTVDPWETFIPSVLALGETLTGESLTFWSTSVARTDWPCRYDWRFVASAARTGDDVGAWNTEIVGVGVGVGDGTGVGTADAVGVGVGVDVVVGVGVGLGVGVGDGVAVGVGVGVPVAVGVGVGVGVGVPVGVGEGVGVVVPVGVGVGVVVGVGVGVAGGEIVKLAVGPCGAPVVETTKLPDAGSLPVPPTGMPFQVADCEIDCPGWREVAVTAGAVLE
jgi:hypothetical protein